MSDTDTLPDASTKVEKPRPVKEATNPKAAKAVAKIDDKAKAAAAKAARQQITVVSAKALSTDVGPRVLEIFDKTNKDEEKLRSQMSNIESKRKDAIALTTQAVLKACRADDTIDIEAVFTDDRKRQTKLNEQLLLVLGIKEVMTLASGKQSVVYSKAAAKYLPTGKLTGAEAKRRETTRSNFVHLLKAASKAVVGMLDMDATVKMNEKLGTLQISGPGVQKAMHLDVVTLDERKIEGLKEKPSFAAVGRIAAEKRGFVAVPKTNDRTTKVTTADKAIIALCESLVNALASFADDATEQMTTALVAARNAIDIKLG